MKLLLIEDEPSIAKPLRQGLEQEKYTVDWQTDGKLGLQMALSEEYDLILLDIMLPGKDGFSICQHLRQAEITTPIIILTAKDQSPDIIQGLDTGADDYLVKPFSFEVLLSRIKAILRRPKQMIIKHLQVADLKLDPINKQVSRNNQKIKLSPKEYLILEYLTRNAGKVLSKEQIINHVWDFDCDILPNNLEVFIHHLRDKIDKPFPNRPLLHTVYGFGYKLGEEA
ncbi:MAG TPA: response regulator transcription factor [Candidatus Wirthbacteria bacterium]|nr:response regulator transcription factor [Candidatus Wirthbacteria bacterium]